MIETTCRYCGKEFKAIRVSKKFCSDSCKTKANMKRRNEEKETNVHKVNDRPDSTQAEIPCTSLPDIEAIINNSFPDSNLLVSPISGIGNNKMSDSLERLENEDKEREKCEMQRKRELKYKAYGEIFASVIISLSK